MALTTLPSSTLSVQFPGCPQYPSLLYRSISMSPGGCGAGRRRAPGHGNHNNCLHLSVLTTPDRQQLGRHTISAQPTLLCHWNQGGIFDTYNGLPREELCVLSPSLLTSFALLLLACWPPLVKMMPPERGNEMEKAKLNFPRNHETPATCLSRAGQMGTWNMTYMKYFTFV